MDLVSLKMLPINAVKISFEKKEKIFDLLSEIIEKVDGKLSSIYRIEKSLNRFISRRWNLTATKAIKSALSILDKNQNKKITKSDVRFIESHIESGFSDFDSQIKVRLRNDLEKIYKISRNLFHERLKVHGSNQVSFDGKKIASLNVEKFFKKVLIEKQDGDEGLVSFDSTDKAAIDNLTRLYLVAVNDFYPNLHKDQISKIINDAVFGKGLAKREAGEFLQKELSRRLGGFDESVPESILRQGQRSISSYFEGLSTTTVTRARNFGQISLMDEIGVLEVIWVSVEDDRTSEICLAMNGRVFTIDQVKEQMSAILSLQSSEDLKSNFGWRKDLSEFGLRIGDRLSSFETSQLLVQSGVPIVPPAHFRCRSELVPR